MTDDPQEIPPNAGQAPGFTPPPGPVPPPYGYQPIYVAPKHPQATTVLVLGILSLVLCQLLGPFAWVMGNKAKKEIDANPTAFSGEGEIQAGRVMGIISTALLVVLAFVILMGVAGLLVYSTTGSASG
ncbi:hypothetical protein J2X11_002666 [Aeromicrobium panaciterrae]|uniref:DUF4190 domain-containing protein n=1 Tax=Aeromicrobium panaciterrae TaxID=363861 RepID=A0ABU1URN3_9ACTN|nr:DUF4190 domain-containing protein [Aeromicrobium panaciterrae]MDR7087827.1 hypothetical protein [Aeromicrobium panaciterrae]